MTLYLRDELLALLVDRRSRNLPMATSDHFFGTWIASQIGHTDPEFTFSVYQ
jgi:hypothetical protein